MHGLESEKNKDKIHPQWICDTQTYEPSSPMKGTEDKEKHYPKGDKFRFSHRPYSNRLDLRSFSRTLPSLLDTDDGMSVRDDCDSSFTTYLTSEQREETVFAAEDGDEVQPLPRTLKGRWTYTKPSGDQKSLASGIPETCTLLTEDISSDGSSFQSDTPFALTPVSASVSTTISVSPSAGAPEQIQGEYDIEAEADAETVTEIEADTRFEQLYRLGTQEVLLKRTLGYIKGLEKSKRSIIMDIKWREHREKSKANQSLPEIPGKASSRLYSLSKSKQEEGKKRRDQIAMARASREAERKPACILTGNLPGTRRADNRNSHRSNIHSCQSVNSETSRTSSKSTTRTTCNSDVRTGACNRLYNLSKKKQEEGKQRRGQVAKNMGLRFPERISEERALPTSDKICSTTTRSTTSSYVNERRYIAGESNGIHDSLYNFSKNKQIEGRQKRNHIARNSGERFPTKWVQD